MSISLMSFKNNQYVDLLDVVRKCKGRMAHGVDDRAAPWRLYIGHRRRHVRCAKTTASARASQTGAVAHVVMAYKVMAFVVMAYVVMAYVVMAYVVMAYVVMAYVVMALYLDLVDLLDDPLGGRRKCRMAHGIDDRAARQLAGRGAVIEPPNLYNIII